MLNYSFFSLKPLPLFGTYEPTHKRTPRPSRSGQRWIIQLIARFAVAASCTSSAAALDLDRVRTSHPVELYPVQADTHFLHLEMTCRHADSSQPIL